MEQVWMLKKVRLGIKKIKIVESFLCLMYWISTIDRALIFKESGGLIPFRDYLKLKLDLKPQTLHIMGNLAWLASVATMGQFWSSIVVNPAGATLVCSAQKPGNTL
jgi:hypothetical protein